MSGTLQVFKSTDLNAPTLTGQVGSLITLLDKCLVTGYSTATITSISRGGTGNLTALAKLSAADNTLYTGVSVVISGCTGTGSSQYNGTYAIKVNAPWAASTVYTQGSIAVNDSGKIYICRTAGTSASSGGPTGTSTGISDGTVTWDYVDSVGNGWLYFSYQVASDPGASASGSPVYAKAPAGPWTHPFAAGTNAQTYRSTDTAGGQMYLQVVDNAVTTGGAKEFNFYGAEAMSADQTVTSGRFPTAVQLANGLGGRKSVTADSTARAWTLVADGRTLYFFPNTGDSNGSQLAGMGFGYAIPVKSGDAFNTFVAGNFQFTNTTGNLFACGMCVSGVLGSTPNTNFYWPRQYQQTGTAVAGVMAGPGTSASVIGGKSQITFPNGADSGFYCEALLANDGALQYRARMPGIYESLHNAPWVNYDEITNVTGLSGVTLMNVVLTSGGTIGQILIDKFGPWQ
jgi:hypothetical protein